MHANAQRCSIYFALGIGRVSYPKSIKYCCLLRSWLVGPTTRPRRPMETWQIVIFHFSQTSQPIGSASGEVKGEVAELQVWHTCNVSAWCIHIYTYKHSLTWDVVTRCINIYIYIYIAHLSSTCSWCCNSQAGLGRRGRARAGRHSTPCRGCHSQSSVA